MNAHGRNAQAAQTSAFAGNDAAVAVAEHLSAELWGPLTTRDRAHLLKTKQNKTTPSTHQGAENRHLQVHCAQLAAAGPGQAQAAWTSAQLCPARTGEGRRNAAGRAVLASGLNEFSPRHTRPKGIRKRRERTVVSCPPLQISLLLWCWGGKGRGGKKLHENRRAGKIPAWG